MTHSKINLVDNVGGQAAFNFVLMNYCESIRKDPSIKHVFAQIDLNGLIELQKEILNAAFMDTSPKETDATMGRMAVKYQSLWQMGLNDEHFDAMKAHILLALRHAWVEESLIEVVETQYDQLRPFIQQSGKTVRLSVAQRPSSLSNIDHGVNNGHHQRT
jgi:truncated hemoglobin YjbI